MSKYIVGIDEAGRGPLAGPVAVGLAVVPADFDWRLLLGVTDSKQLTEQKREELYELARQLQKQGILDFTVVLSGPQVIDQQGISVVIRRSIGSGLRRLKVDPVVCEVRLDGLLKAPQRFTKQQTIVKGDQKEKVNGLASIVAKVTRDRRMVRLSSRDDLQPYDLATHKGYGTKKHRQAIAKYGLSAIHRQTYCKNITVL